MGFSSRPAPVGSPQDRSRRVLDVLRAGLDQLRPILRKAARESYDRDEGYAAAFDRWWRDASIVGRDADGRFEAAGRRLAVRATAASYLEASTGASRAGCPIAGEPSWSGGIGLAPVPRSDAARRFVRDLRQGLVAEPLGGVDPAVVASLYTSGLPAAARSVDGQFATPPGIAETLVRWAIGAGAGDGRGIPRVLDPATGTGTFAVQAYRRLADEYPNATGRALLDRVVPVDVNALPLHLAARSLAALAPAGSLDDVPVRRASFFDLDPDAIGPVDAVVGNPPYVEAADLRPDRDHYRRHLGSFGPGGETPYLDGPAAIGKNADAYVYFVTHATRFLREGGRLAVILPTKWLSSRYGEGFRGFLTDHYRVEAVIGLDARAFPDALVETALVLLERRSAPADRETGVVEFLRLDGTRDPDTVLETIRRDGPAPTGDPAVTTTPAGRSVRVGQAALGTGAGKLAHYLDAPRELLDVLGSPALVPLGELADVSRGAMTGSTAFFFPDAATVAAYGIEDAFVRPAVKSMRDVDAALIDAAATDRRFVDVHGYVEAVRDRRGGEDGSLAARVKRSLEDDGYLGLLDWIRDAEDEGEHRGATCRGREVWFDYGEPPRPAILLQKLLRERVFAMYNRAGAVPSNAIDGLDVRPGVDERAVFGALNASLTHAIMEVWGRNEAGMLQLMTYETRSLPVPDVRAMPAADRRAIVAAVDPILDADGHVGEGRRRDRLDAAVLDAIDAPADLSVDRVQGLRRRLRERRLASGEPEVDDGR